ncbi:DNA topoisomerase 3 [Muribaculaceae bacterium]|nr:DNA topoisomerase 3 [Muribaculaceae bacterium]
MKQKNLITVVTDHQITADTIARAIGANEKHEGYYLGNGYAVTWTNGQLVEATFSPQESFVLSTTMESRLAYAHNFKFAMRNYDELVGYKKSAEDNRQLDTIKALWKMSLTVVNAMRPDITGDLDFLSLYYFIACPVDTHRAWLPVLTKKAIVHAVNHGPQNRKEYEKWLEESIYNAIVQAAEENVEPKGSPAVEEISASDAAKDAECAGIPAPAPG